MNCRYERVVLNKYYKRHKGGGKYEKKYNIYDNYMCFFIRF